MRYELYYWPSIPGRGEFIRLALEEAGADYVDVARADEEKGTAAMMKLMGGGERPPFAPPFLKAGELVIGQTANILLYLGGKHGLAPRAEAGRLWAHQLQLTIADFVSEVHDTHHPIASSLYYEDQKKEAKRRAADFLKERAPKFLGYFERVLQQNPKRPGHLVGARLSYPDLSLFQIVEGLRYAFPKAMTEMEKSCSKVVGLRDAVADRPNIFAYRTSDRRIPFNKDGIFRQYEELDVA